MLNREQRRESRQRGEALAYDALILEFSKIGPEGLESFADGLIDTCGRVLGDKISLEYAHRTLQDAADRLGRFARRESGT